MTEQIEQLVDGIYFSLDQAIYHGQKRLSASGMRDMLVSPATFWANSWMNPDRDAMDAKTEALIAGSAYHVALLEPDDFDGRYCRLPDLADYADREIIRTGTEIKAKFKDLGEPQTKSGELVYDAALRLDGLGTGAVIWPLIEADHAKWREDEGLIGLKPALYFDIERDMKRVQADEAVQPFIVGGESEVTILWTDKAGIRWKARLDKLNVRHVLDLKTFDNSRGNVLDKAIANIIQYDRLYIQARHYVAAAEIVRTTDLPIKQVFSQDQKDLIAAIRKSPDPFEFWWIFLEKGGVPNLLARQFQRTREVHPHYLFQAPDEASRKELARKIKNPTKLWSKAELEIEYCAREFLRNLEVYGEEPWQARMPVSTIDDEAFPPYWLDEQ